MFQFTTTTIFNTATDPSGKTRWDAAANDLYIKGINHFKFDASTPGTIYRRYASNPVLAKSTIVIGAGGATYEPGDYQLTIQLNYQGSQNSFYATPVSYTKGKPLFYAFSVTATDSVATIAQKITKIAKWIDTRFDNKWLNISNSSSTLSIDAIDEYQRIVAARIEKFVTDPYGNATWETKQEATVNAKGREGFGTYTQLLKDLRLPTAANTTWLALNQEERPIPGELYNQYTLQYVKNRGIMGQSAVGSLAVSSTSHVFYVRQSLATAFETVLKAAGLTILNVNGPGGLYTAGGYPKPTDELPIDPLTED
jgi:hypothetical protein